jgi:transposase
VGARRLAPDKKNARRQGAHVVFIDESGFSLTPTLRRTWAPRGQTPVIAHVHDRRSVSAIAALSVSPGRHRVGCWMHLWPGSLDSRHVVAFLRDLLRHLCGRVIVVWDRLAAHRSAAVGEFVRSHPRLSVQWLPAYAPELNPVEWLWAHLKGQSLAHLCPDDEESLLDAIGEARGALDQTLLRSLIRGSGLPWNLR